MYAAPPGPQTTPILIFATLSTFHCFLHSLPLCCLIPIVITKFTAKKSWILSMINLLWMLTGWSRMFLIWYAYFEIKNIHPKNVWRIPLFPESLSNYARKFQKTERMFHMNNGYLLFFNCLKDSLYWFFKRRKIYPGYRHKINLLPPFLLINISVIAYLVGCILLI